MNVKTYFTDENVQKEQGIIAQEIKIYLDDPSWRVFFNNLCGVYHNNPVRIDIAGTVESISHINKELLYRCYGTFYNLNNMTLSIAGNFDPAAALEICGRMLNPSEDIGLDAIVPDEPPTVKEKRVSQKLYCALPLFQLGFKLPSYKGSEAIKKYIEWNILLEAALGSFSPFYSRCYDSGLISDSFSAGVFRGRGFFLPFAAGDSKDPDRLTEEIKKELYRLKKEGIPEKDIDVVRKITYGDLICSFNNVSSVAKNAMNADLAGADAYTSLEYTASVKNEDILSLLDSLDIENSSLSVVEPLER